MRVCDEMAASHFGKASPRSCFNFASVLGGARSRTRFVGGRTGQFLGRSALRLCSRGYGPNAKGAIQIELEINVQVFHERGVIPLRKMDLGEQDMGYRGIRRVQDHRASAVFSFGQTQEVIFFER